MEITKCLTVSTKHITLDTFIDLDVEANCNVWGLPVYEKAGYGYWIYCSEEMYDEYPEGGNIPKDLWDCMKLAHKHDCRWLCIDCDGEELKDLLPLRGW